jgi:Tfp pilus assembly protein PilO
MSGPNAAAQLAQLATWWQQRNRRERLMIAGVAIAGVLALVDALAWQPMQRERRQLQQRIEVAEQGSEKLGAKLGASGTPGNAAARAVDAQKAIAATDEALDTLRRRVVTPARMAQRMRELLDSAKELGVLAFRNLPPQSSVAAAGAQAAASSAAQGAAPGGAAGAANAAAPASGATDAGRAGTAGRTLGLYRHPLEIRVAGAYGPIAAWVARIEESTDGIYLSSLQLETIGSGRIEARVELFTLGTEATWLTL